MQKKNENVKKKNFEDNRSTCENWEFILEKIKDKYEDGEKLDKKYIAQKILDINYTTLDSWTRSQRYRLEPRSYVNFYMFVFLAAGEEYWGNIEKFLMSIESSDLICELSNDKLYKKLASDFSKNKSAYEKRKKKMYEALKKDEKFNREALKKDFPSIDFTEIEEPEPVAEEKEKPEPVAEEKEEPESELKQTMIDDLEVNDKQEYMLRCINEKIDVLKMFSTVKDNNKQKEMYFRKKNIEDIADIAEKKRWIMEQVVEYMKDKLFMKEVSLHISEVDRYIVEPKNIVDFPAVFIIWCDKYNWSQQKKYLHRLKKNSQEKICILVVDSEVKENIHCYGIDCAYPVLVTDLGYYNKLFYDENRPFLMQEEIMNITTVEYIHLLGGTIIPWW